MQYKNGPAAKQVKLLDLLTPEPEPNAEAEDANDGEVVDQEMQDIAETEPPVPTDEATDVAADGNNQNNNPLSVKRTRLNDTVKCGD